VRKRVYGLGPTLEANYDNAAASGAADWKLKKVRLYVTGPDGMIGAREFDVTSGAAGTEKALVYHLDHLGSTQSITPWGVGNALAANATGESGRYSEDPWGARRNPFTWTGVPPANTDNGGAQGLTPRGFTGHEMLDDLGFVHMNGRIYDPLLGRFLSADVMVQAPGNLQSFNRYSYVFNNPLSYTDPSGDAAVVVAPVLVTAAEVGIAAVGAYVVYRGTEIALQETMARIHAAQDRREVRLMAEQRLKAAAVSAPQAGDGGKLDTTVVPEDKPALTTGAPAPSLPVEDEGFVPDAAAASAQVETVDAASPSDTPTTTGGAAPASDVILKTDVSTTTQTAAVVGQEAHRQIQKQLVDAGYRKEVTMTLSNGQVVRKDAVKGDEVVIIKPDTESGRRSADKRVELMEANDKKTQVILYDPKDPKYQPGSSTYIGPKK